MCTLCIYIIWNNCVRKKLVEIKVHFPWYGKTLNYCVGRVFSVVSQRGCLTLLMLHQITRIMISAEDMRRFLNGFYAEREEWQKIIRWWPHTPHLHYNNSVLCDLSSDCCYYGSCMKWNIESHKYTIHCTHRRRQLFIFCPKNLKDFLTDDKVIRANV